MRRIVIKVGGSLLFSQRPFWDSIERARERVGFALSENVDQIFYVIGGGELVESMRLLDRLRPGLDEESLHWMCIDLLSTATRIASTLCPQHREICKESELKHAVVSRVPGGYWVSPSAYYRRDSHADYPDSHWPKTTWETTSDTLAWLLAWRVQAEELYLLKSCRVNEISSMAQAAELGIVDAELARLSRQNAEIPVRLLEC